MTPAVIILEKVATFVGGAAAADLRATAANLSELIDAAKAGEDAMRVAGATLHADRLRQALVRCGAAP